MYWDGLRLPMPVFDDRISPTLKMQSAFSLSRPLLRVGSDGFVKIFPKSFNLVLYAKDGE